MSLDIEAGAAVQWRTWKVRRSQRVPCLKVASGSLKVDDVFLN